MSGRKRSSWSGRSGALIIIASAAMAAGVPLAAAQDPAPATSAPACADCGVVESVRIIETQGQASGVGLIAGGLAGGILGHQVGQGRGNTAATIVGAGAGAYVGNRVEQSRAQAATRYEIAVKMNDGSTRNLTVMADPGVKSGDKVRVADGKISRLP